jgi:hypothetical protein
MRPITLLVIATLCSGLLLMGATAEAQQAKGMVTNRDGAARSACQVNFSGPASYSVWTNSTGAFFLEAPRDGQYAVTVKQGELTQSFTVTISRSSLSPSTLVVNW